MSLQTLLREIKNGHPDWALHVSVLTQAGMEVAREKLPAADRFFYSPLDFSFAVRRVLRRFQPGLLVLAESELWPNLLRLAAKKTGGILVVNGRVSERSYRRYGRLRFLARRLLGRVSLFLVQSETDRERLIGCGADPVRVRVAGNLKCEIVPAGIDEAALEARRSEIGLSPGKKVLVAGSTRVGEEILLLDAFLDARGAGGDAALILAPRHVERVPEVIRSCRERGLRVRRRSEARAGAEWDVLVLDTIGELAGFYALGDAAFVGGSLVPWGGHNLLEPAAFGKPVFFGPHMRNFAHLAEAFLAGGGARTLKSPGELRDMFLFRDPDGLKAQGERSLQTLKGLQGATRRTIEALEDLAVRRRPGGNA
jgi:3-deoxy-D-manno-octulosonic-acid transferase